jgi:hypothetical protein
MVGVTPRPRFRPGEGTHGGWVGLRESLGTEATGKVLSPLPGIKPRSLGRQACSQTLYWLSYPAHNFPCQKKKALITVTIHHGIKKSTVIQFIATVTSESAWSDWRFSPFSVKPRYLQYGSYWKWYFQYPVRCKNSMTHFEIYLASFLE